MRVPVDWVGEDSGIARAPKRGCGSPASYPGRRCTESICRLLSFAGRGSRLLRMYTLARLLQAIGLTIPPLAIVAQLYDPDHFGTGEMLKFLLMAVGIFLLGYLMQRFGGSAES